MLAVIWSEQLHKPNNGSCQSAFTGVGERLGTHFLLTAETSAVTPEAIIIVVVIADIVVVVVVRTAIEGEAWIEPKAPEPAMVAKPAMAKMACEVTMAKAAVTSESTVPSETVASGGRQRKRRQSERRYQASGSLFEFEHWLLL